MMNFSDIEPIMRNIAFEVARLSVISTCNAQSGHPTSCLSLAPFLGVLYGGIVQNKDTVIWSKGHAAPALYALAVLQKRLSEESLLSHLRRYGFGLSGHPIPFDGYVDVATGSLGQGLAVAVGKSWYNRQNNIPAICWIIMGDGECAEGSVWEAIRHAGILQLPLRVYLDYNGFGQFSHPFDSPSRLQHLFEAAGWQAIIVDGTNFKQLYDQCISIEKSNDYYGPVVIIGITPKGYPLQAVLPNAWHGKPIPEDILAQSISIIKNTYNPEAGIDFSLPRPQGSFGPLVGASVKSILDVRFSEENSESVRRACGNRVAEYAVQDDRIVAIDGDVANSTYFDAVQQVKPAQFFQAGIAEQLMISAASGIYVAGGMPFVSTFSSFLTRAHDQIRMAALGNHALRIIGTHPGVSVGSDGPSQMGLEDIALFRSIPDAMILYPSDSVSAQKCIDIAMTTNNKISYIRATRVSTPIIYQKINPVFPQGFFLHSNDDWLIKELLLDGIDRSLIIDQESSRISHKDSQRCLIITAGILVHEALKAQKIVREQNIFCAVLDCYSIVPLPIDAIKLLLRLCDYCVIIAEDHYAAGGLADAILVCCADVALQCRSIAITSIPPAGSMQDLLRLYSLDAEGLMRQVLHIVQAP